MKSCCSVRSPYSQPLFTSVKLLCSSSLRKIEGKTFAKQIINEIFTSQSLPSRSQNDLLTLGLIEPEMHDYIHLTETKNEQKYIKKNNHNSNGNSNPSELKLQSLKHHFKKKTKQNKKLLLTLHGTERQHPSTSGVNRHTNMMGNCRSISSYPVMLIVVPAQPWCQGSQRGHDSAPPHTQKVPRRNSSTKYTHNSSILLRPKNAPSMSLLIPLRCIFKDFRDSRPWNVRLSTILIRFLFSSLI